MRVPILFFGYSIFILLTAVGCSNSSNTSEIEVHKTKHPDATEILILDSEADIFQFDGVIYQTGIEWIEELTFTKDEQVGEIKKEMIQMQILKMKCPINYLLVQKSIQPKKKEKLEARFYS